MASLCFVVYIFACLFILNECLEDICHPPFNVKVPQYIIGYGSLIDDSSKNRTDPTAEKSYPIKINGYERGWAIHGTMPRFNTAFLAAYPSDNKLFNGIIYRLANAENVIKYDTREDGYCREEVKTNQISISNTTLPVNKQIWIYVLPKGGINKFFPTIEVPIVQSYVDIFIRGCIQVEKDFNIQNFSIDCIKTTKFWPNRVGLWVNDRLFPRRPLFYEPKAGLVDKLLKQELPDQFDKIILESQHNKVNTHTLKKSTTSESNV